MAWIGNTPSGGLCCQVPRDLSAQVAQLLNRMPPGTEYDRRDGKRQSIPFVFELSPRPGKGAWKSDERIMVMGKDISDRGISIYHQKPIPFRRGVLEIDLREEGIVHIELDLLWCRFTQLGWYESGGRLLGVTSGLFASSQAG